MAKIQKRYIKQLEKVWSDLWEEAYNAMSYVDSDNDGDEKFEKVLDKLYDRFDKAMAHIKEG